MIYVVVGIKDRCADMFSVPNFVQSIGQAIRGFTDEVNRADAKNIIYLHPDDFDLYELGKYDDTDGSVEWLGKPRQLILGKDAKQRPKE